MSIENVTTALQAFATTGSGFTVTLPAPRLLTFKVQGNGNVTAGAVAIECCPQDTPISPGSGSEGAMVWTTLNTISVPANKTTEWVAAGSVFGTFRARISTPVTGGTVTVLAVRPEEQFGMVILRPLS
jgi:hypothetical protein